MYAQFWRQKLTGDKTEHDSNLTLEVDITEMMDGADIEFPEEMCPAIAKITDKFSFAYMQEAFVAALLGIAMKEDDSEEISAYVIVETAVENMLDDELSLKSSAASDDDLDEFVLWRELKKQIGILRDQLGDPDKVVVSTV
jgi:transitional endoplasmic reticulum ATPase